MWNSRTWVHCLTSGAIGVLVFLPVVAWAEKPLTIDQAVHLALTNNERAIKAPLRVEVAKGQLERARAAFLPTMVAGGT